MKLVDEIQICETCEADMDYVGLGEWNCECGHVWYAEWLDGPGLVEWLRSQLDTAQFAVNYPALARRVSDWQNGKSADFYRVDGWLVKLDIHTCELPDHLWCEKTARGKHRTDITPAMRRAALRRVDEGGEKVAHIARELGVTPRAISLWRNKLAAAA